MLLHMNYFQHGIFHIHHVVLRIHIIVISYERLYSPEIPRNFLNAHFNKMFQKLNMLLHYDATFINVITGTCLMGFDVGKFTAPSLFY